MAASPAIHILLSTYNGERFLRAQLESFVAQTHTGWVLHWRDDGSTDATVAIMRDFAQREGAGRCREAASSGPHIGAAASFLALLTENAAADAVAFADQDDVWLPEKLARAAAALAGETGPALYCARQILVDEALGHRKLSASHSPPPGFPASLTQNIANGNTVVMNRPASELVVAAGRPPGTVHDWWSYIVVSACGGKILFDEQPTILYRLHAHNLIAASRPLHRRALAALKRGPAIYMTMMRRHADLLALLAPKLSPQARRDLETVRRGLQGGLGAKLVALRCPRLRRRTRLENLLFCLWFLMGPGHEDAANPIPGLIPEPPPHWSTQRKGAPAE